MKIIVSGANGFVGEHLCLELFRRKYSVLPIVRELNPKFDTFKQFVVESLDEAVKRSDLFQDVTEVVHLAARVHLVSDKSSNQCSDYYDVNVRSTLNFAKQAALAGVKRFIYVSSIKVNGELTENQPFTELSFSMPQDPYAISKWQAEQALLEYSKTTVMEVVIVRPPLVYGPGVKANFLSLLKIVNKKIPLPVKTIKNKRSMIYVDNLVDALITCANHPNAVGKTYLVSDGEDASTPDLIKKLAKALNTSCWIFPFPISIISFLAGLVGKKAVIDRLTQSLVVDSSKIREELGWHPPYAMEQGLKATAEWYIQSLNSVKK